MIEDIGIKELGITAAVALAVHGIFKSVSGFPQRLTHAVGENTLPVLTQISAEAKNKILRGTIETGVGGAAIAVGLFMSLGMMISHSSSKSQVLTYGILAAAFLLVGAAVAGSGVHRLAEGAADYVQANRALSHVFAPGM